jgi:murein L,D-transpeptidase YafK
VSAGPSLRRAALGGTCLALAAVATAAAASRPSPLLHVAAGPEPETVLIVEKDRQRLLVYECRGAEARLLRELPCTTGKAAGDKRVEGDLKTPEGVYWFRRYIPDEALPPLYGAGALTMDYPNDFDRHSGKTGSGIWMHGVETDDRVEIARDTRGCVALRNDDFRRLLPLITLGRTPIVVVKSLEQADPSHLAAQASDLRALLDDWRRAWEAKDLPRYLAHYHESFRAPGHDGLTSWARHKAQLAQRYAGIRVGIDDVTMLREKDRAWLTFRQEYASDGHRDVGLKTLALLADGGHGWRILSERWRPLDEDFLLIDPDDLEPLSPTLLASLYPDAAASGPAPSEQVAPVLEDAPTPPPVEAPPEAVEAEASAPDLRPRVLRVDLRPEQTGRRAFRLLAPHARMTPVGIRIQVQLLNTRPTRERQGVLEWTARVPGLAPLGSEPSRRPLTLRQGELLRIDLPLHAEPGRVTIEVRVDDAAGRLGLRQALVLDVPAEGDGP